MIFDHFGLVADIDRNNVDNNNLALEVVVEDKIDNSHKYFCGVTTVGRTRRGLMVGFRVFDFVFQVLQVFELLDHALESFLGILNIPR